MGWCDFSPVSPLPKPRVVGWGPEGAEVPPRPESTTLPGLPWEPTPASARTLEQKAAPHPPPTFPTAHWASSARRGYSVRGAKQPGILQAVLTWASVLERGGRAPCAPRPLRLIAQRAHNPLRLAEEWGLLRSACADHKRAVGDDLTRCHCPKRRGAA